MVNPKRINMNLVFFLKILKEISPDKTYKIMLIKDFFARKNMAKIK